MQDELDSLLAALPSAGENEKKRLIARIHEVVRHFFIACLIELRAQPADAEDIAQDRLQRLVSRILSGEVTNKIAYTRRTARNAFFDHGRKRKARREVPTEDPALASNAQQQDDPSNPMTEAALKETIQALLGDSGDGPVYLELLRRVYLHDTNIETLIQEDLSHSPRDSRGNPRTHKNAADAVYKRLERARTWLRSRLVEGAC